MADVRYWLGPWIRDAERQCWRAYDPVVGLLDFGSNTDCAISPVNQTQRGIGMFVTPRDIILPSECDLIDSGDGREIVTTAAHRDLIEAVLGVTVDLGKTLAVTLSDVFALGDPTGLERWKPLTPNRDGLYEIHLGGHSQIWSERFTGTGHRWWNRLRDLLRADFKQLKQDAKDEAKRLRDEEKELRKQGKIPEADAKAAAALVHDDLPARNLGWLSEKYRCLPSEIDTDVEPKQPQTTITDAFGASLTGWTSVVNTWSTDDVGGGNYRAKTTSDGSYGYARNDTAMSSSDHYAEAKWYYTERDRGGVVARFSSSATTCYAGGLIPYGTQVGINKVVSGSFTNLNYSAHTVSSGQAHKCDCSGSSITGYIATSSITVTDTAISGNFQAGLIGYRPVAYWGNYWDDFYATDGLSGATPKGVFGLLLHGPLRRAVYP